jgi:hypothetical protein
MPVHILAGLLAIDFLATLLESRVGRFR